MSFDEMIGIRVTNNFERDMFFNYSFKQKRFGIIDSTYIFSKCNSDFPLKKDFLVDPETSILSYNREILKNNLALRSYATFITKGKIDNSINNLHYKETIPFDDIESMIEEIITTTLEIQHGHLLKQDKYLDDNVRFTSEVITPYFTLFENDYLDRIVELNNNFYKTSRNKLISSFSRKEKPIIILEIPLNDLNEEGVIKTSISKIIDKNNPNIIILKIIRKYPNLSIKQIGTLYNIFSYLKKKSIGIIVQNPGIEGLILCWLLNIQTISRGLMSEKIYTFKSLPRKSKEYYLTIQKYPSINDTYSRDFLCFTKKEHIDCNCEFCENSKKGENIRYNKIGHNLRQISYEKTIIDNLEDKERKYYIKNLVKVAIDKYRKNVYPDSHFKKLNNTIKIIQEVI